MNGLSLLAALLTLVIFCLALRECWKRILAWWEQEQREQEEYENEGYDGFIW